jgi:hypothetical protein
MTTDLTSLTGHWSMIIEMNRKMSSLCRVMQNWFSVSPSTRAKSQELSTIRLIALLTVAFLLLAGCASVTPKVLPGSPSAKAGSASSQYGWWYARFVMNWPPDKEPSWHVDLLLAQLVVSPVLSRFENDIKLWRFHRRAARDQAGHQFSFIFYATQGTAREVFAALQTEMTLEALRAGGVLIRDNHDDTSAITRPNIEDTSDRSWSLPVQKSWPYYIQGVSEMWLNLIAEVSAQVSAGKPPSNLDEALEFYRQVNPIIERIWQEEGQHAFLHHLNAIFGYEPLVMRHKFLLGF